MDSGRSGHWGRILHLLVDHRGLALGRGIGPKDSRDGMLTVCTGVSDDDLLASISSRECFSKIVDGLDIHPLDRGQSVSRLQFHRLGTTAGNHIIDEDSRLFLDRSHPEESRHCWSGHGRIGPIGGRGRVADTDCDQVAATKTYSSDPRVAFTTVGDLRLDSRNGRVQHISQPLDGTHLSP